MSSLIVVDVALARSGDSSGDQPYEWIKKRINCLLSNANKRFEEIKQKNERVIRLHEEITRLAELYLNPGYPAWKSPESSKKAMDLLFRKADRFRILLIQILLEENETRLLEEMFIREVERIFISLATELHISSEDPEYQEFSQTFQDISRIEKRSDRIMNYKTLISSLVTFYCSCRFTLFSLQKRISKVQKDAASLELQNMSLSDLETLHALQGSLSSLHEICPIQTQIERLNRTEEELTALAHRVSGMEHTNLGDIVSDATEDTKDRERVKHDASMKLLAMEADFFYDRIKFLDFDKTEIPDYEPVAKETSPERLALQRENLQLEYGLLKEKIPGKTIIREELEEIIQNLSLDPDAGALLDAAMILYHEPSPGLRELTIIRRQYDAYYLEKKSKSLSDKQWGNVINILLESLKARGYRVKPGKIADPRKSFQRGNIEVLSLVNHYSIMISINHLDELVFRLVRIVDGFDIDEFDTDQLQKDDVHAATVWERDYEILKEELKNENIHMIERLKKNPDEVPIQQLTRFDILTKEHIS